MPGIQEILDLMKRNPNGVSYADLCKVCEFYFGKPRQPRGSHRIYRTPWQGDPRINIQNHKGKAKAYQVKQVLRAIERLEINHDTEE